MYHYGFVALSVRMCVAGANKVEGTMSLCSGTNEILTSKHDIAALKVKQGHFIETAILVIHNLVIFYSPKLATVSTRPRFLMNF